MAGKTFGSIGDAVAYAVHSLKEYGTTEDSGHWQGVPTEGKPDLKTREILDLSFAAQIPPYDALDSELEPNLPWAEDHFQERVSRIPSNPGEAYQRWPWWDARKELMTEARYVGDTKKTDPIFQFSHTYQERFWPKEAEAGAFGPKETMTNEGIRYPYGDLDDVVALLLREPHTRQAYFPIFFPEDTGAVHGGRIPCSLGYHFLVRSNRLHCWYDIRSCDAVRHFRDDLYLACRLTEWVLSELVEAELRSDQPQLWVDVELGLLFFSAHSFHVHYGDYHLL